MSTWAIGDIHGSIGLLEKLWAKLDPTEDDVIVFLGDLIDRGDDSKGVIDFVRVKRADGYDVRVVKGNHEDMAVSALRGVGSKSLWLMNGGNAAINSFGGKIPEDYIAWMEALPITIVDDGVVFVHAAVSPNFPLCCPDPEYSMWAREEFTDHYRPDWFPTIRKIMIGHTPRRKVWKSDDGKVVSIDTGAVFRDKGYGKLTAYNVNTDEIIQVDQK